MLNYQSFIYLDKIFERQDKTDVPEYYDSMISLLAPLLNLLPNMITNYTKKFEIYVRSSTYPFVYGGQQCYGLYRDDSNCNILGNQYCISNPLYNTITLRINSITNGVSLIVDVMSNLHEICHILQYIRSDDGGSGTEEENHAQIFSLMMFMNYYSDIVRDDVPDIDDDFTTYIHSIVKPQFSNSDLNVIGRGVNFISEHGIDPILEMNIYRHYCHRSPEYSLDISTIQTIMNIIPSLSKTLDVESVAQIFTLSREFVDAGLKEQPYLPILFTYAKDFKEFIIDDLIC